MSGLDFVPTTKKCFLSLSVSEVSKHTQKTTQFSEQYRIQKKTKIQIQIMNTEWTGLRLCALCDDDADEIMENYNLSCARWSGGGVGLLYSNGVFREWSVIENKSNVYDVRIAPLSLPEEDGRRSKDVHDVSFKGPWSKFEWIRFEEERDEALIMCTRTANRLYLTRRAKPPRGTSGGFGWGSPLHVCATHGNSVQITCFAVSELDSMASRDDKIRLVTGDAKGLLKTWTMSKGQREGLDPIVCKLTIEAHEEAVDCVKFLSQRSLVVSASEDRTIRMWSAGGGALVREFNLERCQITSMVFLSSETILACGTSHGALMLWDIAEEEEEEEEEEDKEDEEEERSRLIAVAHYAEGKIVDLDAVKSSNDEEEELFIVAGTSDGSVRFYRGMKLELLGVEIIKENVTVGTNDSNSSSGVVTCEFCKIRPENDKVGGALFVGTRGGAVVVWSSTCIPYQNDSSSNSEISASSEDQKEDSDKQKAQDLSSIFDTTTSNTSLNTSQQSSSSSSPSPSVSGALSPTKDISTNVTSTPTSSSSLSSSSSSSSSSNEDENDLTPRAPISITATPRPVVKSSTKEDDDNVEIFPRVEPCLRPTKIVDVTFQNRNRVKRFTSKRYDDDNKNKIDDKAKFAIAQLGSTKEIQRQIAELENAQVPILKPTENEVPTFFRSVDLDISRSESRYSDLIPIVPDSKEAELIRKRNQRPGKQIDSKWLKSQQQCTPSPEDISVIDLERGKKSSRKDLSLRNVSGFLQVLSFDSAMDEIELDCALVDQLVELYE